MSKLNKFQEKAVTLEAFGDLYEFAENRMRNYMNIRTDEEGNRIKNAKGEYIYDVPEEDDSYSYRQYRGWVEVLKKLDEFKI